MLARRFVVVGDPGQLEPITLFPVERFEAAVDPAHHALPRFLLEKNLSITPFRLRVTRRLPPDTVPFVQAFYPEMSFSATAHPEERRVSFAAAGIGDAVDRTLDKVAAGREFGDVDAARDVAPMTAQVISGERVPNVVGLRRTR